MYNRYIPQQNGCDYKPCFEQKHEVRQQNQFCRLPGNISSLLCSLLPKDFDSADIILILILVLLFLEDEDEELLIILLFMLLG